MSGDDYCKVDAILLAITSKAVHLDVEGCKVWVPRSVLHGADDIAVRDTLDKGDTRTWQIRQWFCEREGLI